MTLLFYTFLGLYSPEAMENYKSSEAYRYFIAGWVQDIKHVVVNNVILAKCDVRPSYRTTEDSHTPWVALSVRGSVIAGHCTCMAG